MSNDELYVSITEDKVPYIKKISNDSIINLTGESGSGKSFYAKKHFDSDDFIVIDTDEIFARFNMSTGVNREYGEYLRKKYDVLPDLFSNFDLCYKDILEYFNDCGKTVVIDSALFKSIKDITLLRGTLIVIRTSVDKSYKRSIERYIINNPNVTEGDIKIYSDWKRHIYSWYLELNNFLDKVEKL